MPKRPPRPKQPREPKEPVEPLMPPRYRIEEYEIDEWSNSKTLLEYLKDTHHTINNLIDMEIYISYEGEATATLYFRVNEPNPNYDAQMAEYKIKRSCHLRSIRRYNLEMVEYKEMHLEWCQKMVTYEKAIQEENRQLRYEKFVMLQKEFGDAPKDN